MNFLTLAFNLKRYNMEIVYAIGHNPMISTLKCSIYVNHSTVESLGSKM